MMRLPLLLTCWLLSSSLAVAGDWYHWRGPEQTGVSRETNLPDKFSLDPKAPDSNLIWKAPYGGRSTPIVMNGRVFIINGAGDGLDEQERVMCFDANTGKVLWEQRFNVFQTDIVSNRVGWTTLAADQETGNIYAHGIQGLLFCFDRDGKILWSHSMTEEYGRISGYGGRVTSPIVDENLVILGMVNASWGEQARGSNRFVAFDKKTGTPVWWSELPVTAPATYYSVPVIAVINGERELITGASDGSVQGIRSRTGQHLWSFKLGSRAINNSPVVQGTRVYVSHGEENDDTNVQGRVACLDVGKITNGKPEVVWKVDGIRAGFVSPILHEGRLYCADDKAMMYCLDAETGKQLWKYKYGRTARGSGVLADGKIYIAEVASNFHILKPGPKKCEALHEQFFRSSDGQQVVELNGNPAIANGRIYFQTRDDIYCVGKKDVKAATAASPEGPKEAPADKSAKVAHIQIVPADVVLRPGESVSFKVLGFDDKGRFVRDVSSGKYTLAGMLPPTLPPGAPAPKAAAPATPPPPLQGEISGDGKLTIAKAPPGQAGRVVVSAEGQTSYARVRVVPNLPYKQDFDKVPVGRVPAGWVNAQGKFLVEQKDGATVLRKTSDNPNPLLARAFAYIGPPTMKDYVIECDLSGTRKGSDLPDMGIVNARYSLILDGNKQQLRLLSWEALPRVDKSISFPWKENVWYRMKLVVDAQGDKAITRGKVWPRDQKEPEAWSIEFEDPVPNKEGSPALYGYSTGILGNDSGTIVYYDNVSIVSKAR